MTDKVETGVCSICGGALTRAEPCPGGEKILPTETQRTPLELAIFAAVREARAEEREACAKIAEDPLSLCLWGGSTGSAGDTAKRIANRIRERGGEGEDGKPEQA